MVIDDRFVYGTQYYRAPTPLPEEWEEDLKNMHRTGIDTIQLRVQWRKNEPAEGQYDFEDTDRLFELAEKYDKKVIFKFLMENAPDYIFHKYNGTRRDNIGSPLAPGAHGAFYIGGWLPCFDNPDVVRKAIEFVDVFVKRYRDRKELILWNIWNEPRSRPIMECGCEHSVEKYREFLKENFGEIDNLNEKFGKKWESFDTVVPPSMVKDYAELYLWRLWSLDAVKSRLDFMYKAVKKNDSSRPVISHVGSCSIIQDIAGDGSDDLRNAEAVDFYGNSLPTMPHLKNILDESFPVMMCDWLRSVSEYYWVYELYPEWGDWTGKIALDDYKFKVYTALSCGAKGIVYWQYRAERLGCENDLAGLVNIDGSFKEISHESLKIKEFISENEAFLTKAKVKHDGIGILYSQKSDMINRIEKSGKSRFNLDLVCDEIYPYKRALHGAYMLFRELGYSTLWIDSRRLSRALQDVKLLYIPQGFLLNDDEIECLVEFSKNGGIIIAEEGSGLRQENTWLNYPWPEARLRKLFGAKISERVAAENTFSFGGLSLPSGAFTSYLDPGDAESIAFWGDGRSAVTRNRNSIFIDTSPGIAFYNNYQTHYNELLEFIKRLLGLFDINSENDNRGIYVRELYSDNEQMTFVFNRSDKFREVEICGKKIEIHPKDIIVIK